MRALHHEKVERDEKIELKEKKRQKMKNDGKTNDEINAEISADEEEEFIKSDDPFNKAEPVSKYDELKHWDFPVHPVNNGDIYEYTVKEQTLFDIFGEYGTVVKPKLCYPENDPLPPPPKEKPVVVKPPTPKKPAEDDEEGEDGEAK